MGMVSRTFPIWRKRGEKREEEKGTGNRQDVEDRQGAEEGQG